MSTVTKSSLLDNDSGEENGGKEALPDTIGAHLSTPQRESLKQVWLEIPKHMKKIKLKLGGRGWTS